MFGKKVDRSLSVLLLFLKRLETMSSQQPAILKVTVSVWRCGADTPGLQVCRELSSLSQAAKIRLSLGNMPELMKLTYTVLQTTGNFLALCGAPSFPACPGTSPRPQACLTDPASPRAAALVPPGTPLPSPSGLQEL